MFFDRAASARARGRFNDITDLDASISVVATGKKQKAFGFCDHRSRLVQVGTRFMRSALSHSGAWSGCPTERSCSFVILA